MRGQNVLAATVVGLASLVNAAPAASASCVTTTYASVVPTATAVALRSLAYCGGTLYADAYIEVGIISLSYKQDTYIICRTSATTK